MKNLFLLAFVLLGTSLSSFAQDSAALAKELYPESATEQEFIKTFFSILDQHKKGNDPFQRGPGPSISSFQIDKMPFAFIQKGNNENVDLAIFNWDLDLFEGLVEDKELSRHYGQAVYLLKDIDPNKIASQGENNDLLSNFSYVLGSNSNAQSFLTKYPTAKVPEELLDWKPHANYLGREHPLRKALDATTLVLLSPDENLFYGQIGSAEGVEYMRKLIEQKGGFKNVMTGTMVHEMFHVKEGQDQTLGLSQERSVDGIVNREKLAKELDEPRLRSLVSSYTAIVFKLGEILHQGTDSRDLLSKLATVINELKTSYPNAWSYIWSYEYTEGFAEYASAQSQIDAQLCTLKDKIALEISDTDNNIAYRTGTIGGLYLRNKLHKLPFSHKEDHQLSVWEIVNLQEGITASSSIDEIIKTYYLPEDELMAELNAIKEYLVSTTENI